MGFIDSMVAKCELTSDPRVGGGVNVCTASDLATVVGYYAVSRPFLNLSHPRHANTTHSERMMVRTTLDTCSILSSPISVNCLLLQDYYSSGRMLVRMAQAIGRLVLAGRELTRLAGLDTSSTPLYFRFLRSQLLSPGVILSFCLSVILAGCVISELSKPA